MLAAVYSPPTYLSTYASTYKDIHGKETGRLPSTVIYCTSAHTALCILLPVCLHCAHYTVCPTACPLWFATGPSQNGDVSGAVVPFIYLSEIFTLLATAGSSTAY